MKKEITASILLALIAINAFAWQPAGNKMKTKWAAEITPDNVWQEYPRPQFERSEWMNLNGLWDYALLPKTTPMPKKFQGEILVPFCVESSLSGVQKDVMPDDKIWYKRTFNVPSEWQGKKVILNFDAVDWEASVWLNGCLLGTHKGAYDRFSFDITPYLKKGTQNLVVSVTDPSSTGPQACGKQRLHQSGIWYTPVSGIWQTVWLEAVSAEAYLQEVKITPCIDKNEVSIIPLLDRPLPKEYKIKALIKDEGKVVAEGQIANDKELLLSLENPKLWSPSSPFLYDVELVLSNKAGKELDRVQSYFGMRKISLGSNGTNQVIELNNEFLFHYGTLDQGWWPDGLHTPPCDEALLYDIEKTKKMGFNMIRKHIKVEPDRFYYHCDKLGLMVWQDMPSGMAVIPKAEGKKRGQHVQHVKKNTQDLYKRGETAAQFELELRRMVDGHYNAPSIVMWVPMNEGWGQYATCRIASAVKELDPTRLVNAVSGWDLRPCGEVYDIHTYQTEVKIPAISLERASVIGEYGGIGYPIKEHLWNSEMKNWGYQTYHSEEKLIEAYKHKLAQIVEMKKNKGLSAAVYTQTTDVEGEVNGLITYDREVIKIPVEVLYELHQELYK